MEKQLLAWLISSGLDEQRASLYLLALSKGETTASELAKALSIGRTAIYDNLRVLEEGGYLTMVRHGKRKTFIPLSPNDLYKKFEHKKKQLADLLPSFLALYAGQTNQPFAQLFEGEYAAREVYEDILEKTKKEYLYFSPPQLTLKMIDRSYIKEWIYRRIKKKLKSRSLRVKGELVSDAPIFNDGSKYLREIRFLPAYVDLKASIYIYEDNIGVISTTKERVAFIIRSADLAFSTRQIFEFIWKVSMPD